MPKQKFQKILGKRLKEVRMEKRISIRELELRGTVDRSTISQIENGRINPTVYTLKKICEVLEVSLENFYRGSGL